MLKKNTYSKKEVKQLDYKNIKLKNLQELITESSVFVKQNSINHIDPSLLVQSLRQFIKLIGKIKHPIRKDKERFESFYKESPILLYSENRYTRQLLKLAFTKLNGLSSNSNLASFIEIGGIKQLIASTKTRKKCALVIFVEKPTQTNIDFCISNRIYMMSMFVNTSLDNLKGNYKVPLTMNTLKRYFWLATLLELI